MAKLEVKKHCDPIALGANCHACPLYRNGKHLSIPVPSEVRPASIAIVAEAPGRNEELEGRPLIGASGKLLKWALTGLGQKRSDFAILNTLLCRPPKEFTPGQWKQAIEACRPRLERELKEVDQSLIFATGNRALQVTTGVASVTPWYGSILPSKYGEVFAAVHPAFVLRKPAMMPVFKRWLSWAIDRAVGGPKYKWGHIVISDVAKLEDGLKELLVAGQPIAIDIENTGDPMTATMLCVGLANKDLAVSLDWKLLQDTPQLESLFKTILESQLPKVLHNAQHDLLGLKYKNYRVNGEIHDTLLISAVVSPQLSHALTDVAAFEFPANRWKSEFKVGTEDKGIDKFIKADPLKLRDYNGKDAQMTARLFDSLGSQLPRINNGPVLYRQYQQLDKIAMKMREDGVQVDISKFDEHRTNFRYLLSELNDKYRALGIPQEYELGVNGQHPSLSKLFFDKFKCKPIAFSEKTNRPSLDSRTVETYSAEPGIVGDTARIVRQFRKNAKLLYSYIETLPLDEHNTTHPSWRVFGTRTGRWSATDPALQTIPKENLKQNMPSLRNLFCARPGMWLVDADWSALEARIFMHLANAELLIKWFDEFDRGAGKDVHTRNACAVFNTEAPVKLQRDLAKRVLYCLLYGGAADTVWKTLVPDYPELKLVAVEKVFALFLRLHPQIEVFQKGTIAKAKDDCYIEAPLSGRRQVYHSGRIVPTEVVNFPIQSTAGDLANIAILGIARDLGPQDRIIAQVHDAIILEGPDPIKLAGILRKHMEKPVLLNGREVVFPAEPEYGQDWSNLRKFS